MKRPAWTIAIAIALLMTGGVAQAADPTTADCLAATESAVTLGNAHKLRAERAQLLTCAAASCPVDIRKDCVGRVEAVNGQIPTLIFAAKDASGADVSAVKVTMDGEVLAERLEGTALSVDPGAHTFTFETAGQPLVTKTLTILQAQKDRRELVTFGTPTTAPGPSPLQPNGPEPTSSSSTAEGHGLGTQRTIGLVVGGIGVVGLGVGAAFGAIAMSQKADAQNACPSNPCLTQNGVNKWSNAATSAKVADVAFIVAGVGVVGAAVIWFTAPRSKGGPSTQVGVGPGVLQVKASW
jgi:hypothetical protein